VQALEQLAVAGQRPARARRPPPGLAGLDPQVHDRVGAKRLAHPLGAQRAAAERHHPRVGGRQQAQRGLLLAFAERGLALALEELLDRLAELALELGVAVDRVHPQLGRNGFRGAGLAGAHEAHEHERAGGPARQRLHPMRSS
jgi:hypothetical protein